MPATYGPSPFSPEYEAFKNTYKRPSKKEINERWSSSGWRELPKHPKMRRLRSSLGNEYETPDNEYEQFMTFLRTNSELSEDYKQSHRMREAQTPADYIDFAFNEYKGKLMSEQEGVGHISYMWYNRRYLLLKVKFWNGSECVYFRVPDALAATLFALAQGKYTRADKGGKERHLLGIYFWDLVRIRGTIHGTRYPFEYSVNMGGDGTGTGKGKEQTKVYEEKTMRHRPWEILRAPGTNRKASPATEPAVFSDKAHIYELAKKAAQEGNIQKFDRIMSNNGLGPEAKMKLVSISDASPRTVERIKRNVERYDNAKLRGTIAGALAGKGRDAEEKLEVRIRLLATQASKLNATNKKTFDKLGKMRDDDDDMYDGLLRQERYLIKYGLWPM